MTPAAVGTSASSWSAFAEAQPALLAVTLAADSPDEPRDQAWAALLESLQNALPADSEGIEFTRQTRRLLLSFARSDQAVSAALHIQRFEAQRPSRYRIGADLRQAEQGAAAATALAELAVPGEVLLSEALRDQIVAGLDAELEYAGEPEFPELQRSLRLFRLLPRPEAEQGWGDFLANKPTLVLLPLRVAEGQRCDPVYAELVGYGLSRGLAQNKAWHLISSLSAAAFRHRQPAAAELQQRLKASHVLSGEVHQEGRLLHAQIRMVDTASGQELWARTVSLPVHLARSPENPFGREVVSGVSQAIFGEVARAGLLPALDDLDSYTLLFKAMTLVHRSCSAEFLQARELLDHLVQRHPKAGEAQAWLAKWHVMNVARGQSRDIEADTRLAQQAAQQALHCEGDRALGLAIDGLVHAYLLGELDQAEAQLKAAIAENANEALAWLYLSAVHVYRDQGQAAADAAGMAMLLSPLDPMRYYFDSFAAHALLAAGRLNESIVLASRSLSANRRHLPTLRTLAIARALNGQLAQASEAVQALRGLDPSYSLHSFNTRYPGRGTAFAARCAMALQTAGLPEL
ncbi:hypothetical protein LNV23_00935 [Paucibacter sp. DJ1R-11]|uniref:hypothetical protein n=1 Tax=Paucibacter sp. DJ1R-11 TaxID=2893556 RepID=UPI0021E3ADE7|nr:hypothetical protein [Paucibacter sp. DJ1R-11]MCV2362010.1 hypothetical protein [Paucibacter sp. DJ1R-11]